MEDKEINKISPEEIIQSCCSGDVASDGGKYYLPDYIMALKKLFTQEGERKDMSAMLSKINESKDNIFLWTNFVYLLVSALVKHQVILYDNERIILGEMRDYALDNYHKIQSACQYRTVIRMPEAIVVYLRNVDGKNVQHKIYDKFEETRAKFAAEGTDWNPISGASWTIPK